MTVTLDQAASTHGIDVLSSYRVSEGLQAVHQLATLQAPAAWKAIDMATRDYMAHDDPPSLELPQGRTWAARDTSYGYTGALGEIIDYGKDWETTPGGQMIPLTPEGALKAWTMGGPTEGHYQIIHIHDYNAIGYAVANDTTGNAFHIAVFGIAPATAPPAPTPTTPPPPPPLPPPPPPKSLWRPKLNPLAKPVFVTGYVAGMVLTQNHRGQPLKPMLLTVFLRRYVLVS